jgi:uncharacterized protein
MLYMRYAVAMLKYIYLCSLILVACTSAEVVPSSTMFETATISLRSDVPAEPTVTLTVEMAKTPQQQAMGYMNRTSIPKGTGMLFVFEEEKMLSFWMKDTPLPLDIAFFNTNRELVSLKTMPLCTLDPCPAYSSSLKAKYALEVPKDYFEQHGIDIGWRLGFL